jgi:hypothetical protein
VNTTPVTPFPTPAIHNVFFARPVNKAAQAIVDSEAISEVRRAINAWSYGEVGAAEDCPCCEERAVFGGKCHACPFDAR